MKNGGSLLFLTFFSLSMSEVEYLFIFLNRFIDIYFTFCITYSFKVYSWMFLVYSQVLMPLHRGAITIKVNFSTSASLQREAHILSLKKQEFQKKTKHLLQLDWLCQSLWLCGSQKLWKILQEMGIPDHLTCLLRNLYACQEATVRTEYGTIDGSKLGKEYIKAVYCHRAYLTYMQSTSWEMLG